MSCTGVLSTKIDYKDGYKTYQFHNIYTNDTIQFFNCEEVPETNDSCTVELPKPTECKIDKNGDSVKDEPEEKEPKKNKKPNKTKSSSPVGKSKSTVKPQTCPVI